MQRTGEVHCYLCGEVSGTWEWSTTASPARGLFRSRVDERRVTAGWLGSLRCVRCGGSVYLEAMEPVRSWDAFDVGSIPPPRRGRPPKHHALAS
jgi:hypothetical protein